MSRTERIPAVSALAFAGWLLYAIGYRHGWSAGKFCGQLQGTADTISAMVKADLEAAAAAAEIRRDR
jgi:hypothetical protein